MLRRGSGHRNDPYRYCLPGQEEEWRRFPLKDLPEGSLFSTLDHLPGIQFKLEPEAAAQGVIFKGLLRAALDNPRSKAADRDVADPRARTDVHVDVRDRDTGRRAQRREILDDRHRRPALGDHDRSR